MGITEDKLRVDGIGHFLGDNILAVPTHQRSYAWKEDNVKDFWLDVSSAYENARDGYFIGTIVLSRTADDVLEVVDGQQRLATTTIILGAIRDWLIANEQDQRAKIIEDKYLLYVNEDTLENEPRLSLNTDDGSFFTENVVERSSGARKSAATKGRGKRAKESHERIADACDKIRELVYQFVGKRRTSDAEALLRGLVKYIVAKVKVISVTVPSHEDAYTIFETLNDRGLDLSKADLLKNHLYRTVGKRLKEAEDKWSTMMAALEATGKRDIAVDYIRYHWISLNGHVRTKDLYAKIKESKKEQTHAIEYLNDLSDSAILYAAILNSDHPRWDRYGDDTRESLANLIMFGIDRMHPIVLAVVRTFSDPELKKAFYYLVCASVRITIAGKSPGGVFEERIAETAPRITNGEIKTAKELASEMADRIVPNDAEFEAQFSTANVSKSNLAKYYLRALENSLDVEDRTPARVSRTQSKYTLEHVLPENPSKDWGHIPADNARAFCNRIGNLALLPPKPNADIGNKDFQKVKVPAYRASGLALTAELSKIAGQWTETNIEDRQKRLAAMAVKTWPLKIK